MNVFPWQIIVWDRLVGAGQPLPQALLLKGRRGIGKLAFARILAASLLCESPQTNRAACGKCPSCNWLGQGSHPDFRLIEPAAGENQPEAGLDSADRIPARKARQYIGVDQIRALAGLINVSTHRNGYRIILIHPAEAMNASAANALLKSLEEPPPQSLFILVSHRPQQLPPTIVSRCRQVAMPLPEAATSELWLRQQGIDNAPVALAEAGYAPMEALECAADNYRNEHEAFIAGIKFVERLDPINLAEEIQRLELPVLVNWMQKWCYDLMSYRLTGKIRYHLAMVAAISALSSRLDPQAIGTYYRKLAAAQRVARHPLNAKLLLEEILYDYARMTATLGG